MSITGGPPLKKNLGASAAELKDFIASLKGKSSAEAMGMVTRSKLVRAIGISLAVQVGVLLILTIPFAIWKKEAPAKAAPTAQVAPVAAPATKPATKKSSPTAAQPKDNGNNVTKSWDAKGPSESPSFRDDILKDNR